MKNNVLYIVKGRPTASNSDLVNLGIWSDTNNCPILLRKDHSEEVEQVVLFDREYLLREISSQRKDRFANEAVAFLSKITEKTIMFSLKNVEILV